MKKYTRTQFIILGAKAGTALLLSACGMGTGNKNETTTKEPADTVAKNKFVKPTKATFDLVHKNDKRYNVLRQGFNKRIDKYPQAIALCTSTNDVVAAINYAKEKKLAIAVKSGGHNMEGFSCNDGGMVINLSEMNKVEIIEDTKIKVQPGCILSKLNDFILPKERLLPAGSCGTVGLGGLTLGGGYGLFARKFGLTCDHLLEATIVDGNGIIRNTKDDTELLWALKGGGTGNFGVVTEMIFSTQVAPKQLQAHYFKTRKLDALQATMLLKTWMEIVKELPDSCFSGFVLNGSTLNILITNYDIANAQLPLQLKKLASVVDNYHSSSVGVLGKMLHNYYGRPGPLYFRNSCAGFFKDFNDVSPFISSIFEKTIHTPGMIYQVNTLGGKINDVGYEKSSSYPHRNYDFVSELQAYWDKPEQENRATVATTEILKITKDNGINRQYVNYCSLEFHDWENAYYGDNYSRLQAVKRKYDIDNNIRHPQSVKI